MRNDCPNVRECLRVRNHEVESACKDYSNGKSTFHTVAWVIENHKSEVQRIVSGECKNRNDCPVCD